MSVKAWQPHLVSCGTCGCPHPELGSASKAQGADYIDVLQLDLEGKMQLPWDTEARNMLVTKLYSR